MKINKKLIFGILLAAIGAWVVDMPIIKHVERQKALPGQLIGFVIIAWGAVMIYRGKKQQASDRERDNI